jgi:hypothetical protein
MTKGLSGVERGVFLGELDELLPGEGCILDRPSGRSRTNLEDPAGLESPTGLPCVPAAAVGAVSRFSHLEAVSHLPVLEAVSDLLGLDVVSDRLDPEAASPLPGLKVLSGLPGAEAGSVLPVLEVLSDLADAEAAPHLPLLKLGFSGAPVLGLRLSEPVSASRALDGRALPFSFPGADLGPPASAADEAWRLLRD